MTNAPSVLVFAGSTREESLNKRLAKAASLTVADMGGRPNLIDLKDFPAPIYNGDAEEVNGVPPSIIALTALIREHDGLIIATPEYNGFFPSLVKNTLDWCSRPGASEENPSLPRGKPACVMACSPGGLGGIRVIPRLRDCLSELGFLVSPEVFALGNANDAFGDDGRLTDQVKTKGLRNTVGSLLALSSAQSE